METLEHKEEVDRSVEKTNVSFPIEIVEEILSRLPVKSILRYRSVSKQWLSLISDTSFTKLQFTRATVTGLFFSGYDVNTHQHHYFSAANDGGPLTKLMASGNCTYSTPFSHLNGLVCFTCEPWITSKIIAQPFVVNPSTRRIYKLPGMNAISGYVHIGYLYGFHESTREYKILHIRKVLKTRTFEFIIFSMSSYSWRKIDAEPPLGFSWDRLRGCLDGGVCVNSVVHVMFRDVLFDILAFDFVMEKFSVISIPQCVLPHITALHKDGLIITKITKIDGCLGVVFYDKKLSEFHIVLLQDYDKHVWVKETIQFPQSWNKLVYKHLSVDVNMDDEIVFFLVTENVNMKIVHVYNRISKCFKTLQYTLDNTFPSSKYLTFEHIKCYVESIISV